ncbi:antitoxin VapB family protein [Halorussus halobius]|uniref:antitoxin VapB family protein n=1 Tax=Halorussus halobius TaxID=1710537 RepID=UPI00109300F2|nr:antitoxin VapB family protein [Halorussus halobius]
MTVNGDVNMATDHIRISEDAKERLESRKREGESFTDVIMRLTDRDADVRRFIGKYDDVDLEAGVENVTERLDREFRAEREDVRR